LCGYRSSDPGTCPRCGLPLLYKVRPIKPYKSNMPGVWRYSSEFISNINNGLLMVSDPEFVSSYISNFTDALRIIAKYMVNHEELASKVMTELQRVVRDGMKILM